MEYILEILIMRHDINLGVYVLALVQKWIFKIIIIMLW